MTRRSARKQPSPPAPAAHPGPIRAPFAPQPALSNARIAEIHDTALRVLEELGISVLDEEARGVFRAAGAKLDGDMVFLGRDIVAEALTTAPKKITLAAPNPDRSVPLELGRQGYGPGAGCPNVTDRVGGRRPGTLADFENALRLCQHFDAIHFLGPCCEPQDVPAATRHLAFLRAQLTHSDKAPFLFARGRGQVMEALELQQKALGLDDATFRATPHCMTVINTNSPRLLDRPMGQGILDFARMGQLSIITPFCLAGAMAPITIEGALVLQHAEALMGITLAQLAHPGAPVIYGAFGSNVDMKSGAPAFGTPEQIRMTLASGQLARHIGLPWRSAAGTAANLADAQGAGETHMALWATLLAGATMTFHAAGWLEGGLTFGFEKFLIDLEALQILQSLAIPPENGSDVLAWEALADVPPGGHFFATDHTMARFRDAFHPPLVADLSNHGTWSAAGGLDTETRATALWQQITAEAVPPAGAEARVARIADDIARIEERGGTPILD